MNKTEQMIVDARTVYSQWRNGTAFSSIKFRETLNHFEAKAQVHQTTDIRNTFSKMKLLYNLAEM